jgi:hypothetical protein
VHFIAVLGGIPGNPHASGHEGEERQWLNSVATGRVCECNGLVSTLISRKSTSGFRSVESADGQTWIGRFRRDYINPLIKR